MLKPRNMNEFAKEIAQQGDVDIATTKRLLGFIARKLQQDPGWWPEFENALFNAKLTKTAEYDKKGKG
jgi:hypothetical protein